MASTVLHMSISVDGFIAGPNESWDDNPLGDDGGHSNGWFPAGGWCGDHHDGAPSFIYSRHEPRIDISPRPLVTYVTAVETARTGAEQFDGLDPAHIELERVRSSRAGTA